MMEQKTMTALVSAFARAYHCAQNTQKVFDDYLARKILSDEEYNQIADNMSKGIGYFSPSFVGTAQEALRWVVDNNLSPSPLGRAAFAEKALEKAVQIGARQYLIFAAGYDTFAYRQPTWGKHLQIFEIDHPITSADKKNRIQSVSDEKPPNLHFLSTDFTENGWQNQLLACTTFDKAKISFCSLLGISYYLTKQVFEDVIRIISSLAPKGSSLAFDYPDEDTYTDNAGERAKKQGLMAGAAGEKMLASYSYSEVECLLSDHDFLIYEHLTPDEITKQYFGAYNQANPQHPITAFDNVNYCLAVRK